MIYIIAYLILALLWAIYCSFRTSKMGRLGRNFINLFITFITNFLIFPYSVYYSIKNKKI